MKPCRYLGLCDGEVYCAYWDMPLRGDEDIRCHPNGWECYEEPSRGCIFEGRWMTLTEYEEYLQTKQERELPEGYECQEFRLDRESLVELLRPDKWCHVESMTGEIHYLKIRPDYPKVVRSVALALIRHDGVCTADLTRRSGERSAMPQWVASLRLADGQCRVELAAVLKDTRLNFIEGYCSHGEFCPKVEELKRSVVSRAFRPLWQDLFREVFRRMADELYPPEPLSSAMNVGPGEDDGDL